MHMRLVIEETKVYPSLQTIKNSLLRLHSGLEETCEEYIRRILIGEYQGHAKDVLVWVIFAKQPVTMLAIQRR